MGEDEAGRGVERTVYNNFGDKERLFTEIILGITVTAEQLADELASELATPTTSPPPCTTSPAASSRR